MNRNVVIFEIDRQELLKLLGVNDIIADAKIDRDKDVVHIKVKRDGDNPTLLGKDLFTIPEFANGTKEHLDYPIVHLRELLK